MKTRAAVAFEAKKPLEIVELDLEGPKAGEVLVEIMATGICHTDAYTLDGLDSEGLFPSVLGHEGAGIVCEVGAGVTSVKPGDHVIPLYTPECRQCKSCLSGKTNLCTAIRATQGKGLMPDGTTRFSHKGQPIYHYMGCSTFSKFTVLPEIAVAKIREDAPFQTSCYIGCGVTTGVGAVVNTAKVQVGDKVIVFGLGGIGLNVLQGARMAGADMIVGVDINATREEWGRKFGMTHFVNPKDVDGDIVQHLVALTDGGADYTFDCTGNTDVMRQALEACHRGWGTSIVIGVAEAGKEIAYKHRGGRFMLSRPLDGAPATGANGGTIGFFAETAAAADAFHAAGLAHGGTAIEDPPGIRDATGGRRLYIAYLRDSAGNKVCATSGEDVTTMETVSHNRAFGGTQGDYRHRSSATGTDMIFSVYVPPHDAGARLSVVWYLSGLTCTHANVTDKGEYRRACAELGADLRMAAPRQGPSRRREAT